MLAATTEAVSVEKKVVLVLATVVHFMVLIIVTVIMAVLSKVLMVDEVLHQVFRLVALHHLL